jgi:DNA-binding NtrC family response regulator
MHIVGTAEPNNALALLAVEDEHAAGRSDVRLLITAATQRGVEAPARRIHGAGLRAEFPFVRTWACDLSSEPEALRECCCSDAATGGTLLISDVEKMPPIVQGVLLDVLARLEFARRPSAAVRLISGTTVSLLDRVTAGTFSDRLFYRLNVIHLTAREGDPEVQFA